MRRKPKPVVMGAWAETPSGPGWANRVIWMCLRDPADGRLFMEAMQPDEMPPEIAKLFGVFAASSASLLNAVILHREKRRRR